MLHIGESCTDGVGACQSTGTKVCAALDGTATLTCNADRSACTWVADPPPFGFWNVQAETTDLAGRTGKSAVSTISIN